MIAGAPQSQRAGDNSTQTQIYGNVILQQGVTEERAVEIALTVAQEVIARNTEEAAQVAQCRVEELDKRIVPLLAASRQLEVFADPAFLVALRSAQIGAASTDREGDYEMLAGLLADHAARSSVRPVRAGIRRAIEVVDQLDTEALRALTVHAALTQYSPAVPLVADGLAVMEELFSCLAADGPLPLGGDWIDHLEVLDAVRVNTATNFKKYGEYFSSLVPGYVAAGLSAEAEEIPGLLERLKEHRIRVSLVPHELKPGFVRFPVTSTRTALTQWERVIGPDHAKAATDILESDFKIGQQDPEAREALVRRIHDACPNFAVAADWWDSLTTYFHTTGVGKVLARANASRLYSGSLPPLT